MAKVKIKPLEEYLRDKFTSEDEKIFLEHYKIYKECFTKKNECLISLDDVYEDMGFTRKDHAKTLLMKKFAEGEFKVEEVFPQPRENSSKKCGRPSEIIKMTYNTFLSMCMLASTEKAQKTREYYLKLESVFIEYTNYEIAELRHHLEKKEKKLYELGDTVYIEKDASIDNLYKVGESENMNTRSKNYRSHTITGEIVFTQRCNNRKILEDVIHHVCKPYRYKIDVKDYFIIDFEKLKKIILHMQQFLDHCPFVEYPTLENNTGMPLDSESTPRFNYVPSIEVFVEDDKPFVPPAAPEHDFKTFFEQCFIFGDEYKTNWIDISARFRLWSRCTTDIKSKLLAYIKAQTFKETFIYDPKTKTQFTGFLGLQMIPIEPIPMKQNPNEIERFLFDTCVANVTGRVSCKDLDETFVKWRNNPSYTKISASDKKALHDYCNQFFLASTVHTGERIRFGFYGLSLKGHQDAGRKAKIHNRKIVEMFSGTDVIKTFDSITHAAHELNCNISAISVAISAKKKCKGFYFRIKKSE